MLFNETFIFDLFLGNNNFLLLKETHDLFWGMKDTFIFDLFWGNLLLNGNNDLLF